MSQRGVIKNYDRAKKFGFIEPYDSSVPDVFFHRSKLEDDWEPSENDHVIFERERTKKGYAALAVKFVKDFDGKIVNEKRQTENSRSDWMDELSRPSTSPVKVDDRVTCKKCDRKMVPRSEYKKGDFLRQYCPFCRTTYHEDNHEWFVFVVLGLLALFVIYSCS